MGSPLAPVLANVITTELERCIIKELTANSTIPFYVRYVNDMILVLKKQDIPRLHGLLNGFDSN